MESLENAIKEYQGRIELQEEAIRRSMRQLAQLKATFSDQQRVAHLHTYMEASDSKLKVLKEFMGVLHRIREEYRTGKRGRGSL